jgi:hypothetical protein
LIAHYEGKDPRAISPAERDHMIEAHAKAFAGDLDLLKELVAQSKAAGASAIHAKLHAAEGVDNDMLDQALEYST